MIGIIGGLSPYSTALFYEMLMEEGRKRLGREPEAIIYSLSFTEMCNLLSAKNFEKARDLLERAFSSLVKAGAKIIAMPANTPHIIIDLFDIIPSGTRFIDIREASAKGLERLGVKRVGLLATRATIEYGLYQRYLGDRGLEVIVPSEEEIDALMKEIMRIGKGEEARGEVIERIAKSLKDKGAEALLLACTELSTVKLDFPLPVVDSLRELVKALADSALKF